MGSVKHQRSICRLAIIGSLAVAAAGSFADRVVWVDQMVGSINLSNTPVANVKCTKNDWLEVAPGSSNEKVLRYRCGFKFWPFYNSGETSIPQVDFAVAESVGR